MTENNSSENAVEDETQELSPLSLCKWCEGVGSVFIMSLNTTTHCAKCAGTGLYDPNGIDYEQRYLDLAQAVQAVLQHTEQNILPDGKYLILRLNGCDYYYRQGNHGSSEFLADLDALRVCLEDQE